MFERAFPTSVAALALAAGALAATAAASSGVSAQTTLPQPFELGPPAAMTTVASPADLSSENYNYYYAYQTPAALPPAMPGAVSIRERPGACWLDGAWLEAPGT
jgi:hypothetical protein